MSNARSAREYVQIKSRNTKGEWKVLWVPAKAAQYGTTIEMEVANRRSCGHTDITVTTIER